MPPIPTAFVQAAAPRLPYRFAGASALVFALLAAPASAQDATGETAEALESAAKTTPPPTNAPLTGVERVVQFEADEVAYDSNGENATATGNVVLRSEQRSVRADTVTWNRKSGLIVANGNVRLVDENGNQLYTDKLELTDTFEAGSMEDVLLALREGGRLAAVRGERMADGTVELDKAAYSGCPVETTDGCPKKPSWRITSEKVLYDPKTSNVRFKGAYLELFGMRLLPMPGLSVRTDGSAVSGFLIPEIQFSENNGVQVSGKYYFRVDDNKDLELTGHLFTDAPPMISGQWRHLTDIGAYQITGYLTTSRRSTDVTTGSTERDVRGYLFTNGRFQFDPNWSLDYSIRRASDRTFLRRYDISYDDRLRSLIKLERVGDTSYFQLAGYATQTLQLNADQGQVPVALPLIDWRKRIDDPVLGGKIEFQANSLALMRDTGQDTQRAFAGARWDLRRVTGMGQLVTLTGLVRGDVYHSSDNGLTDTAIYRGNPGWETRGVALAALDIQWPFVGRAFGGTQVITPRVQFVASPPIRNLAVPNEDARAVDLEDSNLFALNRFPGYDRVEDGARVTYGVDYDLQFPDWRIRSTVGQSYRLSDQRSILPDGTGLAEQVSDFVGRTEVRYKDFLKLTHRFRLDKDNLGVRRNELDATIGSSKTYAEIGYLRLNRNISSTIEDLRDREELRAATRIAFARYWSVFGSGVFNLTDREEDPTLTSSGFDPVRTRLGVAYEDECLELGLTWRRDYVDTGDARRGNTFQIYFALRNLGFR
ncbi:MAG: LPS-assembly protein LptD [Tsuneonella suprasediminis]|uniref:LPS-assembly protein LptD n=1 Tax=Tsuneonella suprasediminis TaxID=2306996 RepID=A0A419QYN7_9SPHN|nr:LPS assembly protein LptD [Tsuneonella suprasediminis]RJX65946.1 LPS-assembly protein LptD [Tsuneonella suprasediminis]